MKKFICFIISFVLIIVGVVPAYASNNTVLNIKKSGISHSVSPSLYGVSLEDISYSCDGGLNANLINNNSFEYPSNQEYGWAISGLDAVVSNQSPICKNNPTYESLTADGVGVIKNYGYTEMLDTDGKYNGKTAELPSIQFKEGEKYEFSCYLKNVDFEGSISIYLDSKSNKDSSVKLYTNNISTRGWRVVSASISSCADEKGALAIEFNGKGTVCIDFVTLVSENSYGYGEERWKYTPLRNDLLNAIKELNPEFITFPGGCFAESDGEDNLFTWKNTIGAPQERKQTVNIYDDKLCGNFYNSSNMFGYHEFFQLCKDLDATPVAVVGAGIICQTNSEYPRYLNALNSLNMTDEQLEEHLINDEGIEKSKVVDEIQAIKSLGIKSESDFDKYMESISLKPKTDEFKNYVQDILDLIEYANGDSITSYWGALRSANGSPQPFNLKYIRIGNDCRGSVYERNFEEIKKAINKKYPDIKVIACCEDEKSKALFSTDLSADSEMPLIDKTNILDGYDRSLDGIIINGFAEYSQTGKNCDRNNINTAVNEGAFLIAAERNSDAVMMCSYAQLLSKINAAATENSLVWFDGADMVLTPDYYVQMIFANNVGEKYVDSTLLSSLDSGIYQSVTINEQSQELFVKLVNTSGSKEKISVNLDGFEDIGYVSEQSVESEYKTAFNDISKQTVAPMEKELEFETNSFETELAPYSASVVRIAYGENSGKGFYSIPDSIDINTKSYIPVSVKIFFVLIVVLFAIGTFAGYFAYSKLVLKKKGRKNNNG